MEFAGEIFLNREDDYGLRRCLGRIHTSIIFCGVHIYFHPSDDANAVNAVANIIHNGLLGKPTEFSKSSLYRWVRCEAFIGFELLESMTVLLVEGWRAVQYGLPVVELASKRKWRNLGGARCRVW